MPACPQIGKEAAQGLVLTLAKACHRSDALAKRAACFRGNIAYGDVAQTMSERLQNSPVRCEDRAKGLFEAHIRLDGFEQCHGRTPRSVSATRRSVSRLTLA